MDRTVRAPHAGQRALAVLAVVLGLLAMHGLASTHHAAAAATATPHTGAAVLAGEDGAGARHHTSADEADTVVLLGSASGSCEQTCADLALLCVAVLTGVAAALLLALRRARPLLHARARQAGRAMEPPVRHARGPDPVRELCVSRT